MDDYLDNDLYDEFIYIGCIKYNRQLSFFADALDKWLLDLTDYGFIPEGRENHLRIDDDSIAYFMSSLMLPVSLDTIAHTFPRSALTYFIDFDRKLFVDGIRHDGMNVIYPYVPANWISFEADPFLFVPAEIRQQWLSHILYTDGERKNTVEIPYYTEVCAIKYQGTWRFYYEMPQMFILDFYGALSDDLRAFRQVILANFRRNLQLIDTRNVDVYLQALQPHELPANLQVVRGGLSSPSLQKVTLFRAIDFDEKIIVRPSHSQAEAQTKIALFRPQGWHSLVDNPKNFLPVTLQSVW